MTDIEKLLTPTSEAPPCGPDLDHDPAMHELRQAAEGTPESEMGNARIAAVPPNWEKVRELAEAICARTKDVGVGVLLIRALTRCDGLAGLAVGVDFVHAMLDRYWDDAHPRLDPEFGAQMRVNALGALVANDLGMADVREAVVAASRGVGSLTVRDMLVAVKRLPPRSNETPPPMAMVEGVLAAVSKDDAARLEQPKAALASLRSLQTLLTERLGAEVGAELKPLADLLAPIADLCAKAAGQSSAEADASAEAATPSGGAVTYSSTGELRTREDVSRLIDRACEFLERIEPAHPSPLLLRRAQRLLNKSFLDIISDIAPGGLDEVKALAGKKDE